jgi:hypothetical protein
MYTVNGSEIIKVLWSSRDEYCKKKVKHEPVGKTVGLARKGVGDIVAVVERDPPAKKEGSDNRIEATVCQSIGTSAISQASGMTLDRSTTGQVRDRDSFWYTDRLPRWTHLMIFGREK